MKHIFSRDPLREIKNERVKGLVWKWNNRVLVKLTLACEKYCEFCSRKWMVGDYKKYYLTKNDLVNIVNFLKRNKNINEVILSGGDPLVVGDYLKFIVNEINKIKHIKILRIHTRLPIVAIRKVPDLKEILKNSRQTVYISLHVETEKEISKELVDWVKKIRKLGIVFVSQSVFLKGINDNANELSKMFSKLIEIGVRPYYIYHCDNVMGLKKFMVSLGREKAIMRQLREMVSGLAYPLHVVDGKKKAVV